MNVLIIKFRNIGDVLLVGPLLSTIKQSNDNVRVSVAVKAGTEAMLQGHPHVDEVFMPPVRGKSESRWHYLRRELGWILHLRRQRFDVIINATEGDRGAILAFLCGAHRRVGLLQPTKKSWNRHLFTEMRALGPAPRHTVIRNLDMNPLATRTSYRRVHMPFEQRDRDTVIALLTERGWHPHRPTVHVHPTSRWLFKCWNDSDVARTIDYLHRTHQMQVVVTCGPDKRERVKVAHILSQCELPPIDLSARLTLKQTAAVSSLSNLFFGVDTAPMHMAAALDVPVIAVFGPSTASNWGPWPNDWAGDGTPYPKRGGLQRAGQHSVIQKTWSCVPCNRDGCDGSKRSACLEGTAADEVIAEIDRVLARQHTRDNDDADRSASKPR